MYSNESAFEALPGVWAQLGDCARSELAGNLRSIGCGDNTACVCGSDSFQIFSLYTLPQLCDKAAVEAVYSAISPICLDVLPNLRDDRRSEVLGAVTFCTLISTIAVILRLWSRRTSKQRYGLDDLFVVISWILTFGLDVAELIAVKYGYGLHTMAISLDDVITFCKADFAAQILFALASTTIKLSILFFYDRIFPLATFRRMSLVCGSLCIIWCLVFIISMLKSSTPIAYFWDITIKNGTGINENAFFYGISAANVLTDLAVLVLPIPWIAKLVMHRRKKVGVGCIFLLGGFACVAAIIRIPLVAEYKYWDITYTITSAGIWIAVELNIGIVSACVPVMWPLLKRMPLPPYHISLDSLRSLTPIKPLASLIQRRRRGTADSATQTERASEDEGALVGVRREKGRGVAHSMEMGMAMVPGTPMGWKEYQAGDCEVDGRARVEAKPKPYFLPKFWSGSGFKVEGLSSQTTTTTQSEHGGKERARKSMKEGDGSISWPVERSQAAKGDGMV